MSTQLITNPPTASSPALIRPVSKRRCDDDEPGAVRASQRLRSCAALGGSCLPGWSVPTGWSGCFSLAYRRIARPQVDRFIHQVLLCRACSKTCPSRMVRQFHTKPQLFQRGLIWRPFNLRPIGFRQLVFRIGDAMLHLVIISKQQQAFAAGARTPGG